MFRGVFSNAAVPKLLCAVGSWSGELDFVATVIAGRGDVRLVVDVPVADAPERDRNADGRYFHPGLRDPGFNHRFGLGSRFVKRKIWRCYVCDFHSALPSRFTTLPLRSMYSARPLMTSRKAEIGSISNVCWVSLTRTNFRVGAGLRKSNSQPGALTPTAGFVLMVKLLYRRVGGGPTIYSEGVRAFSAAVSSGPTGARKHRGGGR